MMDARDAISRASERWDCHSSVQHSYLPMVKPVVQAVADMNSLAMIQVARVEWEKFGSQSREAVAEYGKYQDPEIRSCILTICSGGRRGPSGWTIYRS